MYIIPKKILLIGDIGVGKTSILTQYFNNYFSEVTEPTKGIEFKTKIFQRKNFKIKLQTWDTSGQEKFKSIIKNYFREADGLLYVFDVTNEISYNNIKNWLKLSKENNNKKNFIKILIGNKIDLGGRKIARNDMETFIKVNGMNKLYEVSAKKDEKGISKMFEEIVDLLIIPNIESSDEKYEEVSEDRGGLCGSCIIN